MKQLFTNAGKISCLGIHPRHPAPSHKIFYMFVPYDIIRESSGTLALCFVDHAKNIHTRYEIPEKCFILIENTYRYSSIMGQAEISKSLSNWKNLSYCKFRPLTFEMARIFNKNKLLTPADHS